MCLKVTSTTTVQCQVLCSSAALNHARGSDWHARTWQCSGHHQDRQCHVAQRACRHFERIYASIATLFHYLLTSTPLGSVLALAGMPLCMLHMWLRTSSSGFCTCVSTQSVDVGPAVVCASERQGTAGPFASDCHFQRGFVTL